MTQQGAQSLPPNWILRHLLAAAAVIILMIIAVAAAFQTLMPPLLTWGILLVLFLLLVMLISRAFSGRWFGILIDDRNKFSLSRTQMVLWTVLILSAFLAAVLSNVQLPVMVYITGAVNPPRVVYFDVGARVVDALQSVGLVSGDYANGAYAVSPDVDLSQLNLAQSLHDGQQIYVPRTGETIPQTAATATAQADTTRLQPTTPLSVQIPSEVWLLLGISTTSLVASPLIKGQKANVIQKNDVKADAKISDLFTGEEASNFMQLDLAKIQMLFFTIIIIGAYAVAVASMFKSATLSAITSLPALDGGVVAMLGVSHAGYLTNKAIPKSDGSTGGNGTASDMPLQSAPPPPSTAPAEPLPLEPLPSQPPSAMPPEPPGSVG